MKNKRFLILGAGGQLGSEWIKALTNLDFEYLATDYPETDISNQRHLEVKFDEFKPDVVINCAAYTAVDKAEDDNEMNDTINHLAAKLLAETCKKHNAILIHYSTDYVFSGEASDESRYPEGYPEDAPTAPLNAYGLAKWKGEEAIKASGANYLILRISWLCGSVGHNFMKTMLRLGKERDELKVVNDQIGSPTFTFDVVDASLKLVERNLEGVWHVTTQGKMSWFDFAKMTLEMADVHVKLTPITSDQFPMKAKRPFYSKLCTKKYEQHVNGHKYAAVDGVRKLLKEL
jgi:dTDP-4-dehydrorhamnose reductase